MTEKKLIREIPSSSAFHSAVFTSFSFDFHHFESQVLKILKTKGVSNFSVYVDDKLLNDSVGLSTGNLQSLSKSYSLSGVESKGAFHSKLGFLSGNNKILLFLGSGNITPSGQGKNHEIFTTLMVDSENKELLPLIAEAWSYLKGLTRHVKGHNESKLKWVGEHCQLFPLPNFQKHQFLELEELSMALVYNEESSSLFQQIKVLIPLNKVKKITVVSPFFDQNGSLLNNLFSLTSNAEMDVFIQKDFGMHPFKMEQVNGIKFYNWEETVRAKKMFKKHQRNLHAKLFIFETDEDNYCLLGSPNATTAAWGNSSGSSVNDELGILYKSAQIDFVEYFGIANKVLVSLENPKALNDKEKVNKSARIKLVKINGVDLVGKTITVYFKGQLSHNSSLVIFNNWGDEQIRLTNLKLSLNHLTVEIDGHLVSTDISFIEFQNELGESLSSKQPINKVDDLINTNPSESNRRMLKLLSRIENGEDNVFDIIHFFNEVHSASALKSSSGSTSQEKKVKSDLLNLSYQDAILLKEKKGTKDSSLHKFSNSVKIWEAIERYFKVISTKLEDNSSDEEEDGSSELSHERSNTGEGKESISLSSKSVLSQRRKRFLSFLKHYDQALNSILNLQDYNYSIVDYAHALIVLDRLFRVCELKVDLDDSKDGLDDNFMFSFLGNMSKLESFTGSLLNLFGKLITVRINSKSIIQSDNYLAEKESSFENRLLKYVLIGLSLVKDRYSNHPTIIESCDLLALNYLRFFKMNNDSFTDELTQVIRNSAIKYVNENNLLSLISQWTLDFKAGGVKDEIMFHEKIGFVKVVKRIPRNGSVKFIEFARPGYLYDEKRHDFINAQLLNLESGDFIKSKQKFNLQKPL